uniref:Uncharacterized protein n=1 Tax=Populus trichocarpa TaxID=3694 RepID=A0A3N7EJL7_POPTR
MGKACRQYLEPCFINGKVVTSDIIYGYYSRSSCCSIYSRNRLSLSLMKSLCEDRF